MKYLALFVLAIILIRIDVIISLGEKGWMMLKSEETQDKPESPGEQPVIVRSESNVNLTPRQQYLNFLSSFRVSPEMVFRQQAMAQFRNHPQMFTEKLDKDLEAQIYSWRDLAVQNVPELPLFLLDLHNILKGENKTIITRFFSVVMDLNVEMFMANYPRTKDITCSPVLLIEEAVPPEEKFPEFYERLGILEEYLAQESLHPDKKLYATICLNTLKLYLEKEAPAGPRPPETPPEESTPAPEGTTL